MSHVREGEIHAYLDGALDRLGEDRAAEIRRHVDGCEDCRARLEEERRVRDAADQLLDSGAPGSFDMPPFEEILRRAEAGRGAGGTGDSGAARRSETTPEAAGRAARRSLRITQRWAWAASLVVALGTGWLLRGSDLARLESPTGPGTVSFESQSRQAGEERTAGEQEVTEGFPDAARSLDQVADMQGAGSRLERSVLDPETDAPPRSVSLEEEAATATTEPVVVGALGQTSEVTAGERDQIAQVVVDDSTADPRVDQPAELRAVGDELAGVDRRAREAFAEAPPPPPVSEENALARSNAEDLAGRSSELALAPGLPVIDVVGDSSGVRVLQVLPEGDSVIFEFVGVEGALALLERPRSVAANEVAAAAAPAAISRDVVLRRADADVPSSLEERFVSVVRISRGSGVLVVRSSRTQTELEALLRSWGLLEP